MKNTNLSLSPWSYNAARILQELENIILDKGGAIVSTWQKERETYTITERDNPGTTITIYYGNYLYISFALDGIYYYYQLDDNMFFPFSYGKTNIIDGKVYRNYYLYHEEKKWFVDDLLCRNCPNEVIKDAASAIFEMLINAPVYRTGSHPNAKKLIVLERK